MDLLLIDNVLWKVLPTLHKANHFNQNYKKEFNSFIKKDDRIEKVIFTNW